ncbi:MAG: arylsulfatase, partial [Planctomycetaceae bacterium]|nr:arylsulfatase [Planctomycetaceae bacterium]
GGKYSIYEGGTRTPFITCWPGTISPGVSDELVCTIDLATSLNHLVNHHIHDDACLDSIDVSDALVGKEGAKGRDHLIQQDNGSNGNYGLRVGKWKLLRHERGKARDVVVERELANTNVPKYQLFNLETDPGEKNNVYKTATDQAQTLTAQLQKAIDDGRTRPIAR